MDSFFDHEKRGGEYQNTIARAGLLLRQPWVALVAGGGLVLRASVRRNLPLALIGGAVLYRGATGRWPLAGMLGLPTNEKSHPATSVPHESGIKVERAIRISKSPDAAIVSRTGWSGVPTEPGAPAPGPLSPRADNKTTSSPLTRAHHAPPSLRSPPRAPNRPGAGR